MNSTSPAFSFAQRFRALACVSLGVVLAVLDSAIANVALPTISRDLHVSESASVWVINAYQFAVAVSILPVAALGDRIGYRQAFLAGLTIFTVASLGCALSGSLTTLTLFRLVQGIGAAGMMSVTGALLKQIYPPQQLGRGIAVNAMIVALSSALGPSIAAAVLSLASWQWLFMINVPIGSVAIVGSLSNLPFDRPKSNGRYDYPGAVANAGVLGLLMLCVDGLSNGQPLGYAALAAVGSGVLGYFFVKRQLTQAVPLLPVDLLRIPLFRLSICTSVLSYTAQILAFIAMPFLLQNTFGYSAAQTGAYMTPWPIVIVVVAPLAGLLTDRHPAAILSTIGLALLSVGLALLVAMDVHASHLDLIWRMALCGAGFALFQSPNNRSIMLSAPDHRSGAASGMLSFARQIGQMIGACIATLLFDFLPQRGAAAALELATACAGIAALVSIARVATGRDAAPHVPR
ncbi:multidrug MFS transporter [Burkholderia territorii]|uniref:Multidrug MFS transporter n=1 Tax=Burkholderia territorii TaxID=1503055 RepID=A0A108EAT3_9BURK|nr:MFS transporter [Burkholderia territorii]KWN07837.1 multidrug MFS transporter [Burkholderia territorii]